MRLRISLIAIAVLSTDGAAIAAPRMAVMPSAPVLPVADTTTPGDGTAPQAPDASPGTAPAAAAPANPAPANIPPTSSGKLQIQPAPQAPQPAQPPNLTIPPAPVTPPPPGQPAPTLNPPPNETIERHQEPGPGGQDPNLPPRGEGAAMIPKQTPSGVQAIEDWIASWFQ